MQRAVRDEVLGRVFGALESLLIATAALGALLAPLLINVAGIRTSLVIVGGLLVVVTGRALGEAARDRPARPRSARPCSTCCARTRSSVLCRRRPSSTWPQGSFRGRRRPARRSSARATTATSSISSNRGSARSRSTARESRPPAPATASARSRLLHDVPRTATVTAVEDTKLQSLERDDFIAAVTGHAPSREAADAMIGSRLASVSGVASA